MSELVFSSSWSATLAGTSDTQPGIYTPWGQEYLEAAKSVSGEGCRMGNCGAIGIKVSGPRACGFVEKD
jgi:hypothetical protein